MRHIDLQTRKQSLVAGQREQRLSAGQRVQSVIASQRAQQLVGGSRSQSIILQGEGPPGEYPEKLPGAYALYDARDIDTTIGGGVEIWPDRIGGRDALTGPSYIPTLAEKDGVRHVAFDGSQWMFAGGSQDFAFLHQTTRWTMAFALFVGYPRGDTVHTFGGTARTFSGAGRLPQLDARNGGNQLRILGSGGVRAYNGFMPDDSEFHSVAISADGVDIIVRLDGVEVHRDAVPSAIPDPQAYLFTIASAAGGIVSQSLIGGIANIYLGTEPLTAAQAAAYHDWSLGSG